MIKLEQAVAKAIPLIKNSLIPASVFTIAVIYFYMFEPFSLNIMRGLHISFYLVSLTSILVLLYFNQRKPIFFIIISVLSYILINYLKLKFPSSYFTTSAFSWLRICIPLNFLVLYFLPQKKLLSKENIYLFLIIFIEFSIGENTQFMFPDISFLIFFAVSIIMFTRATQTGFILDYSLFYATICLMIAMHYYKLPSALTVFFGASSFIILFSIIQDLIYKTYRDELTNFYSRNAYMIHSNSLPLKYSIAIVNIDGYENLRKAFGKNGIKKIIKLMALKFEENLSILDIYRYSEEEFLLIFKDEDKNNAFEIVEELRRSIAGTDFKLSKKQNVLKLTISCVVAEKKRSDANATEVIKRAKKVLQKTLEFSHNVSSKV